LWLKGEGLLTPQQCVFTLTARPGAFDVNRKQAQADPATTGQAALQSLRYGCCHAGLSDKVSQAVEKSPSAALRSSFVIAAYLKVRLIPQDFARLASCGF
jgi:hypothetical protein